MFHAPQATCGLPAAHSKALLQRKNDGLSARVAR
jgi:hypothetical protein